MPKNAFSQLLEKKFLEWQISQGKRTTLKEFSDEIGVSRAAMSFWLNGDRIPDGENLEKLANVLGNDLYDVLDIPRPNPYLQKITRLFDRLSPERQKKIADDVEKFQNENIKENAQRASKDRKTSPR